MANMTLEQWLLRYRDELGEIEDVDQQIEDAEENLKHMTANYGEKTASSGTRADAEAALGDLVRKKDAMHKHAELIRLEILRFVEKVGDDTEVGRRKRRILKLYYAEGKSYEEIAATIRTLRKRNDGRGCYRPGPLSHTTLFRLRTEALSDAELEYRRSGM